MDPAAVISLVAAGSGVAGYILKRVVDHLLGRSKLRSDEAKTIREELRDEIARKNEEISALKRESKEEIAALKNRLAFLEQDRDRVELERDAIARRHDRYKLDVYWKLVNYGADKELVELVLAIPER